jgi:hypothetical protein
MTAGVPRGGESWSRVFYWKDSVLLERWCAKLTLDPASWSGLCD